MSQTDGVIVRPNGISLKCTKIVDVKQHAYVCMEDNMKVFLNVTSFLLLKYTCASAVNVIDTLVMCYSSFHDCHIPVQLIIVF